MQLVCLVLVAVSGDVVWFGVACRGMTNDSDSDVIDIAFCKHARCINVFNSLNKMCVSRNTRGCYI